MGLWKGLLGAGVGLLTGGPAGAVVGGVGGFMDNDDSRTTSTSGTRSGTSTRETQMRDWTDQEKGLLEQAYAGLQAELGASEGDDTERKRIFDSVFNPQAEAIGDAYREAGNRDYANRASRGAANSYAGDIAQERLRSGHAQDKAAAAGQATMQAEQVLATRRAEARARTAAYLQTITQMWNQRQMGSKVVQTENGTTSGTTLAPDTFLPSAFAAAGSAMTDDTSYLNTNILNKTPGYTSPETNYLWDAGAQGPV